MRRGARDRLRFGFNVASNGRRIIGVVTAWGLVALGAPTAALADVYLLDSRGGVESLPWRVNSRWEWRPASQPRQIIPGFDLEEEPVFVTEMQVPGAAKLEAEGRGIKKASSDGATGIESWVVHSKRYPPSAKVSLSLRGSRVKRELVILAAKVKELFILHESCQDLGVRWSDTRSEASAGFEAYLGAYCKDAGGKILVAFVSPKKSNLKPVWRLQARKVPSAAGFDVYEVDKANDPVDRLQPLGQARITEPGMRNSASSNLMLNPLKAYRRWSFNVGLGLTYLQYKEDPLGVTASGMSVSVKGGAHYHLIPKTLELDASGYANVAPLFFSVSGASGAPRFWGANLRMGYLPPAFNNGWQAKVLAGPYVWGMMVPGKAYGLASIIGGQVFGALDIPHQLWRKTSLYVKFAPVGQSAGNILSFKNYEVAIGGAHDLGPVLFSMPMQLLVDASYFKVGELVSATNTVTLMTLSLSAGLRF